MVIARSVLELRNKQTMDVLTRLIRDSTTRDPDVVSGTLPRRIEVTFDADTATNPTPVDEAAEGYLLLAFEHHLAQRGLSPTRSTARQVSRAGTLAAATDQGNEGPVSIFDIHLSSSR
jgi:hypothetical protein